MYIEIFYRFTSFISIANNNELKVVAALEEMILINYTFSWYLCTT